MSKILIAGAQPESLGDAIGVEAMLRGHTVTTVGIGEGENVYADLCLFGNNFLRQLMRDEAPDHVICTVGVNEPEGKIGRDHRDWYTHHFNNNVIGPMRLLKAFSTWVTEEMGGASSSWLRHFVAISSNSATIPRTNSAAYCASKAALSQALRVKAREASGGDHGYIVYGYEPGWIADTPMSHDIESIFGPDTKMHRMRGEGLAPGVRKEALAAQIVMALGVPGAALNGALLRYDGGEL